MTLLVDSSVLIGLGSLGRLALLHELYGEIIIPGAVADEVIKNGDDDDLAREVASAAWIQIVQVENRIAVRTLYPLDPGESEVIVLALERQEQGEEDIAAVDEKMARNKLENLDIETIGTLAILLEAKRAGLIDKVRPEIEALRKNGFTMSQMLIGIIMDQAGEFWP